MEYFDLQLNSSVTIENLQPLLENKISHLMKSIDINGDPKKDVVELGLKTLIKLNKQENIKKLRGKLQWTGDLDDMRANS